MNLDVNVTCNPINIEGVGPGTQDFIWIPSAWSKTNVTAMTQCCDPREIQSAGCFTWCLLPEDLDIDDSDDWKRDFQDCLTIEGRRASGNTSYVAPTALIERDTFSAANMQHPPFGIKGAVIVTLGILSWVLG